MSDRVARWRTVGYAVALVAIAVAFFVGGQSIDRASRSARENRQAIRVSCTLLVNTIIESGASQSSDATRLFVRAIRRVMTPVERVEFDAALAAHPAGLITIPPCGRIAMHPESVRAIPLPTPAPAGP